MLGNCVVLGVAAFGHADLDAVLLQDACIIVTGVLYAAVRVMDEISEHPHEDVDARNMRKSRCYIKENQIYVFTMSTSY